MGKWERVIVLGVALLLLQGCTLGKYTSGEWGAGDYFKHRGQDLCEIVDFGFTYTETGQFALYKSGVSMLTLGYGDVDGYFYGIGGGQLGAVRYKSYCYGVLVWGQEDIGWGYEGSSEDPVCENIQGVGILGALGGPNGLLNPLAGEPGAGPDYMPTCVHNIHLGYVGIAMNLRFLQMFDYMLGWAFIDIAGDDGYQIGTWFRGSREGREPEPPKAKAPESKGAKSGSKTTSSTSRTEKSGSRTDKPASKGAETPAKDAPASHPYPRE